MPVIGFVIFFLVFFVALLIIMYRILGSQARDAMDHLSGLNDEYLQKKEEIAKSYQEAQDQAKAIVDKATQEGEKIKREAVQGIDEQRNKVLNTARNEAEHIISEAKQNREMLKKELIDSLEVRAIDRACELILEIMSQQLREEAHQHWFDELITHGLSEIDGVQFNEKEQKAKVVSAFSLSSAQKKEIEEQLSKKLGLKLQVEESVDPSLVAGLKIQIGHLVFDGSLAMRLRKAALHAQNPS